MIYCTQHNWGHAYMACPKCMLNDVAATDRHEVVNITTRAVGITGDIDGENTSKVNCICGEINARNCPVHQVRYTEFWMLGKDIINNTCIASMDRPKGTEIQYYVHAIEYAALEEAELDLELSCKANALLAEENKRLREALEKIVLKNKMTTSINAVKDDMAAIASRALNKSVGE